MNKYTQRMYLPIDRLRRGLSARAIGVLLCRLLPEFSRFASKHTDTQAFTIRITGAPVLRDSHVPPSIVLRAIVLSVSTCRIGTNQIVKELLQLYRYPPPPIAFYASPQRVTPIGGTKGKQTIKLKINLLLLATDSVVCQ